VHTCLDLKYFKQLIVLCSQILIKLLHTNRNMVTFLGRQINLLGADATIIFSNLFTALRVHFLSLIDNFSGFLKVGLDQELNCGYHL